MRSAIALLLGLPALLTAPAAIAGAPGKSAAAAYRSDYDEYFRKYAKHHFGIGTDWTWFKAQAVAESNLKPNASSSVKARGLMQLMPATYAELRTKNPELGNIDEPRWNIAAGIFYDRQLWNRLIDVSSDDERRRFMFGAYNAGPTTINRARRIARDAGHSNSEWSEVVTVAPRVPQWRHRETLGYVVRIENVKNSISADR